jgi:hypothetical protein
MQAYAFPAADTTTADWQASLDYAAHQQRHPWPVRDPRTPCAHPDCAALVGSLYCSEPCRVLVEGLDADDYDSEGEGCLLGEIETADRQWAADQAAGGLAALACGYAAPATPASPAPLPEAPCSANVGLDHDGGHVVEMTAPTYQGLASGTSGTKHAPSPSCAMDVPLAYLPATQRRASARSTRPEQRAVCKKGYTF